jgi:hypothetical protein
MAGSRASRRNRSDTAVDHGSVCELAFLRHALGGSREKCVFERQKSYLNKQILLVLIFIFQQLIFLQEVLLNIE